MLISIKDVLDDKYVGLEGREVKGYKNVSEKVHILDNNGDILLNEEGKPEYETITKKVEVMLKDNFVNIKGEDAFIKSYVKADGTNGYYVAYGRPRKLGDSIIFAQDIDTYKENESLKALALKELESLKENDETIDDEYISNEMAKYEIPVAKAFFSTNVNQSGIRFDTFEDFLNAEKDTNLVYIVKNMYEVYYEHNEDYNDWFVRVMLNNKGHFVDNGSYIMGYMLEDFLANKDEIEAKVENPLNREDIYNVTMSLYGEEMDEDIDDDDIDDDIDDIDDEVTEENIM